MVTLCLQQLHFQQREWWKDSKKNLQMLLPMHNLQTDFIFSLLNMPENRHATVFPLCEFQKRVDFSFYCFYMKGTRKR